MLGSKTDRAGSVSAHSDVMPDKDHVMRTSSLEISAVSIAYEGQWGVRNLSLHLNLGDFGCLLGPSGCGKTTTLRAIAGLESIARGEIRIEGECVSSVHRELAPERRKVGMVFQENTLFPHLDVRGNVAFGLRHLKAHNQTLRVDEMLHLLGLDGLANRYVHELSGSQRQRVAIARALVQRPHLVLFDEPFSSLDSDLRERIGQDVKRILKDLGITALLVTHDQNEAFALADQIGVMREGELLQWDSAYNIYHEPNDRFVARFVGQGTFLRGSQRQADTVATELGELKGDRAYRYPMNAQVDVLLRPDDIAIDPHSSHKVRVSAKSFKGANILYHLTLASGDQLLCMTPSHFDFAVNSEVGIKVVADHLVVFANDCEKATTQ